MSAPALRAALLGQEGMTIWLTGLSGAGKSTIGACLEQQLLVRQQHAYLIDADVQRSGLNRDLGFSPEERAENVRRLGELCCVLADAGTIAIVAAIAPFERDRRAVRERHAARGLRFFEAHIDTPLAECMRRDPKGLYRRAVSGAIAHFTGISSPYEVPLAPELRVPTIGQTVQSCGALVLAELERRALIRGAGAGQIDSMARGGAALRHATN